MPKRQTPWPQPASEIPLKRCEVKDQLLEFVRSGGVFATRLRESGGGEVEYLQRGSWDVPCAVKASESEFLAAVRQLELDGYIRPSETVSLYDTSEFLLTWAVK